MLRPGECKLAAMSDEERWVAEEADMAFICNDPTHDHFWHTYNWPFFRAPVRFKQRGHDGSFTVSLWVRDAAGWDDLWWAGSFIVARAAGVDPLDRIRFLWRDMQREGAKLEAERDAYYADRDDLEEVRRIGLAVPA